MTQDTTTKTTKTKPKKQRKCLQCDLLFIPKHKHNWVCRKCKIKRSAIEWQPWGGSVMVDSE